ncbi:MAG: short-chain dehydrogenase/reductase [Sphingobacteriaceae bacterium]|nr:short-chain dehydrogenase/reductase [Sphingobacteriaceae bacterium]
MNAIITGASKGMGKAIAIKLAEAGYDLAICARNQSELDECLAQLKQINPSINAVGLQTDVSDRVQLTRFANFVQQHFAAVDVLINNAGTFIPASILDETNDDVLESQMKLNLYAAHFLSKFFGRIMRSQQHGHIINICSVAAVKPIASAGAYTVTKFALLGLTRVLREELMPHNVKVTAILPGSTLSDSWAGTDIPPERFVLVEDIASAVLNCLNMSIGCNVDELLIRPVKGEI